MFKDSENVTNGKIFFGKLRHELQRLKKGENELIATVVAFLFRENGKELQELIQFFEEKLY